ncbi:MAG TPA: hypothetical protein VEC12_02480 [Bacteroidia bacterium]|nr:hypothetical protein [Bacteroidia bacterium]
MKKLIVISLFIIPLAVYFIFYHNKRIEQIEKNIREKYSKESKLYKNKDTLIISVEFSELEVRNLPSSLILRDLIYYDNFINLIETKANFFKFSILETRKAESVPLPTVHTTDDLHTIYNIHKSCKTLLETKKYIYENCSADWVRYGNEFMIYNRKYNYLFGKIKYLTDSPDIISLLTGYAVDWCSYKTTERKDALLYLERLNKTEPEWEKIWPDYGNHIENILKY